MTKKITPFGKAARKYRIDADVRLKTMADELGVTSAYSSAVETGTKNLNKEYVGKVVKFFEKKGIDASDLYDLADKSVRTIRLDEYETTPRELVAAFARRCTELSPEQLEEISKILEKKI